MQMYSKNSVTKPKLAVTASVLTEIVEATDRQTNRRSDRQKDIAIAQRLLRFYERTLNNLPLKPVYQLHNIRYDANM